MAKPVIMPRLGQSVESCIIARWMKKKGDQVKKGEVLLSYETDKAAFDLEAEEEGILLETFYQDGDEAPVLGNIAVIGSPGESFEEFRPAGTVPDKESGTVAKEIPEMEPVKQADGPDKTSGMDQEEVINGKVKISPRARKLAEKLGVFYKSLKGSGPGGRIIERDIEAAALDKPRLTPVSAMITGENKLVPGSAGTGIGGRITEKDLVSFTAPDGDAEIVRLSNVRKLIAKGMLNSLQNSAQLTHHLGADARNILALREDIKNRINQGELSDNITINDMICFAVVKALKKTPSLNAHFLGDSVKIFRNIHLGFAVDTERGLIVPAVRNADTLTLRELSIRLKELASMAKAGNIDPGLISPEAASFTVSNLGAYGVEMFTPVINLPQTAILGVNTILLRPADLGNGIFGFVPYIGLSLTYDHRAVDGGPASAFLGVIKSEIERFPSSYNEIK